MEWTIDKFDDIAQEMKAKCANIQQLEHPNQAVIRGTLEKNFRVSHNAYGKVFYRSQIKVIRQSGRADCIPVVIEETHLKRIFLKGERVEALGEIRTKKWFNPDGTEYLWMYFHATGINVCSEEDDENMVFLEGWIYKEPIYKVKRNDSKLAVLRIKTNSANKSEEIQCVVWNWYAEYAKEWHVGDKVCLYGRFHNIDRFQITPESRHKCKRYYEISVLKIREAEE